MKLGARILLGTCLLLVLTPAGTSPVFSKAERGMRSKAERIQELMELTGAGDRALQMMNAMIGRMKELVPDVPATWWDRFTAKVDIHELESLLVSVYDKHLTDEEIDAMLEFYRTPVGRSIISKMPAVMEESMAVGEKWGRGIAEEILRDLEADGYAVAPGR